MRLLTSDRLAAFPHGFTTRAGGASPPPWDALNLGAAVGDDQGRVEENWRRLRDATGLVFARVRQVHGTRVVRAGAATEPAEEADAVVSVATGVAACVSVADCVPVLLADPEGGAVAAVHAGWRGTIALAVAEGVRALAREGADASRLVAVIGPSIGPCCYEVSPELAEHFRERFGAEVVRAGCAAARSLAREPPRARGGRRPRRARRGARPLHRVRAGALLLAPARRGRTGRQVGFIAPAR
jgi:YfiH family protein